MAGLESLYTAQKVHRPLADALEVASDVEEAHYDRFSVQDGSGSESQVSRHCALYSGDSDVTAYRALPSSAFDSPPAGLPYGIRWLSLAQIHHSLTDDRPVVAFVVIGRTVFFRVELSAVERQIAASWIVAAEDPQVMSLVLGVVRELTVLAAAQTSADPAIDVSRARTAVGHLLDLPTRFEDVSKHVSTAEKALVDIRSTADGLRATLAAQVQDAHRALTDGARA
jgi:hypothetical protein